ncbi:MAG TPA: phosphopantothenoylcysteine decarboxylase [Planctomycetota bacterium]|nr:phosphopantothenoylcysteine decarboxylase [Planctomycetota bacterium]
MRPVLIVGGAPRVAVDAVRFIQARASGATAVALASLLGARDVAATLLLAPDAAPAAAALRYGERAELEAQLARWIGANPRGAVVMSAAINDYEVAEVSGRIDGSPRTWGREDKVPSSCDEVQVRLRPASKLIDQLRRRFGLAGPIIGFKYQDAATVLVAAAQLRARVDAALVVANSIDGAVQALVDASATEHFPDRETMLMRLSERMVRLLQER